MMIEISLGRGLRSPSTASPTRAQLYERRLSELSLEGMQHGGEHSILVGPKGERIRAGEQARNNKQCADADEPNSCYT